MSHILSLPVYTMNVALLYTYILSVYLLGLCLYTGVIGATHEKKRWVFDIENNRDIIYDESTVDITEGESIIDCARICKNVKKCCKASFSHPTNNCFLDSTENCTAKTGYSEGSTVVRKTTGSCKDVYQQDPSSPSGKYIVRAAQAITVYCLFEDNIGYTFISKAAYGDTFDISTLYNINSFAVIRHLTADGIQKQVIVQQLESYADYSNLLFAYNSNQGYQGPSLNNAALRPYLFLGFIPSHLANQKSTQGYRAGNTNYTFQNCDGNSNSYIVFYFNPKNSKFGSGGYTNGITLGWINSSETLESKQYMDEEFFFEFEMHMGGCGGFMTTDSALGIRAALGFPFDYRQLS